MRCVRSAFSFKLTATLLLLLPGTLPSQHLEVGMAGGARLRESFTAPSPGLELQPDRIVLVDRSSSAVLVADFALDSVWRLGRIGSGPGEFRSPAIPRRDARGGAVIPDGGNGRALAITAEGQLSGMSHTRETLGGGSPAALRGIAPDGRAVVFGANPGDATAGLGIFRAGGTPPTRRLVGAWPQPRVAAGPAERLPDGTMAREIFDPGAFQARTAFEMLPSGDIVLVRPDPYQLELLRFDGRKELGPVLPYQPVRVTADERKAYRQERGAVPDNMFPAVLPPFLGLDDVHIAPDGEIWIRRLLAWNAREVRHDLVGPDGALRGSVTMAAGSRIIAIGTRAVYVAVEDPEDGSFVLHRLPRPRPTPAR